MGENTIHAEFRALDTDSFKRSSAEAVDDILNPKPEKAYGYWLTEQKNANGLPIGVMVLAANEIMLNLERLPVHYASGNGRLIAERPDRKDRYIRFSPVRINRMIQDDVRSTVYIRTTKEELEKAIAGYQQLFQENVVGYWKSRQVGGIPNILVITPEQVVRNTATPFQDYAVTIAYGVFRLRSKSHGSVSIEVLGPDSIRYEHSGEYVRIDKNEYEQLLQLQKK